MKHAKFGFHLLAATAMAALLAVSTGGCETTGLFPGDPAEARPEETDWLSTTPVSAPSDALVWERVRLVLAGEGFRPDEKRTRWDKRLLVTDWDTLLAPSRFEGMRRRVHARIAGSPSGLYTVSIAVVKQRNADMDDPSNPAQAQWESAGSDPTRTQLLLWKLQRALSPDSGDSPAK